jgi:hypothetical protein
MDDREWLAFLAGGTDAWLKYFSTMQAEAEQHSLVLYSAFIGSEECIWRGGETKPFDLSYSLHPT